MLLVAVDPQGCAWQVVEQAAELAADLGENVVLMTAIELPEGVGPDVEMHGGNFEGKTARQVLVADATRSLDELGDPFRRRDVAVEYHVREGHCVEAVLDAAKELKPRMLVLGTHRRKGIKRFFLGSVAEQILRRADVPVVTVRSHGGDIDHASAAQSAVAALADG